MVMDKIALTLLVIGGINWGCVGLFQFDLVAFASGGSASLISRIVYTLVGLSAALPLCESPMGFVVGFVGCPQRFNIITATSPFVNTFFAFF